MQHIIMYVFITIMVLMCIACMCVYVVRITMHMLYGTRVVHHHGTPMYECGTCHAHTPTTHHVCEGM